ncbi:hypothetical protein [Hymenobacter rigui]|uniref:Lipocalin-like domain-containing protein n=1 Tax=Hymenobacter rigui TaxID=334424 RepID=A0A428KMC8_9BACT|nr:hypothetical protein [Hymenobacter rigui]RSK47591.1 hypothetical protein EI291_15145 [Hymenobacter rigui]
MNSLLISRLLFLLLLVLASPLARAQGPVATLPGYWNLETNLTTRDYTLVRFYNGQDQLVYEETIHNRCLDLSKRPARRRRTSAQLTLALQQVLRNPTIATQNLTLVAQQLGSTRRVQHLYATQ